MGVSLSDATKLLLSGETLAWKRHKENKAGSIILERPEQRRLIEFLLARDSGEVAQGNETLFEGIVKAWENKAHDPATGKAQAGVRTYS